MSRTPSAGHRKRHRRADQLHAVRQQALERADGDGGHLIGTRRGGRRQQRHRRNDRRPRAPAPPRSRRAAAARLWRGAVAAQAVASTQNRTTPPPHALEHPGRYPQVGHAPSSFCEREVAATGHACYRRAEMSRSARARLVCSAAAALLAGALGGGCGSSPPMDKNFGTDLGADFRAPITDAGSRRRHERDARRRPSTGPAPAARRSDRRGRHAVAAAAAVRRPAPAVPAGNAGAAGAGSMKGMDISPDLFEKTDR